MPNIPPTYPNFYITLENYFQLTGPGFWSINDVPPARWGQAARPLDKNVTIAIFASGEPFHKIDPPSNAAIAGIDWIRFEPNPKKGEPDLNVNHFIIGPSGSNGFPVWGPFPSGSIAGHWISLEETVLYQQ